MVVWGNGGGRGEEGKREGNRYRFGGFGRRLRGFGGFFGLRPLLRGWWELRCVGRVWIMWV